MARPVDRESRIGRRLKLRDLHIFFAVDQHGSMARAAAKLGMSQPSVSEVVANMEGTLGVKLLDRSPKGVETTQYGRALLRRARAAFDELNQAVRDIEFLADPTVGEVRMGCPESIAAAFLPVVIRDFVRDYPGIALHIDQMATPTLELPELRARKIDFVIARLNKSLAEDPFGDDLSVEILFDDEIVVAAGIHSRWTRRRKLGLAELADAQWIQTSTDSWGRLAHRGDVPGRRPGETQNERDDVFSPLADQSHCDGRLGYDNAEVGPESQRRALWPVHLARSALAASMAGCSRDAEESNAESAGSAVPGAASTECPLHGRAASFQCKTPADLAAKSTRRANESVMIGNRHRMPAFDVLNLCAIPAAARSPSRAGEPEHLCARAARLVHAGSGNQNVRTSFPTRPRDGGTQRLFVIPA